jgi:flagellar biogenesis protein FliO
MDTMLRLAWALPLVLLVGVLVALILRRFVVLAPTSHRQARLSLCESLWLSDDTRVYLLEIDGRACVIVESARQTTLQSASLQLADAPRAWRGIAPFWMRRFNKGSVG